MEETARRDVVVRAAELLRALGAEVRMAVVVELSIAPRCVRELQAALRSHGREVSQPLLSQHLRVLRDAGVVTTTRAGTEINYQLADDRIGHLVNDAMRHAQKEER
ncbi:MAG: metalloregulator ArsR/SmtB family transcription factor [Acidimicrobiales bacterium]